MRSAPARQQLGKEQHNKKKIRKEIIPLWLSFAEDQNTIGLKDSLEN